MVSDFSDCGLRKKFKILDAAKDNSDLDNHSLTIVIVSKSFCGVTIVSD